MSKITSTKLNRAKLRYATKIINGKGFQVPRIVGYSKPEKRQWNKVSKYAEILVSVGQRINPKKEHNKLTLRSLIV